MLTHLCTVPSCLNSTPWHVLRKLLRKVPWVIGCSVEVCCALHQCSFQRLHQSVGVFRVPSCRLIQEAGCQKFGPDFRPDMQIQPFMSVRPQRLRPIHNHLSKPSAPVVVFSNLKPARRFFKSAAIMILPHPCFRVNENRDNGGQT